LEDEGAEVGYSTRELHIFNALSRNLTSESGGTTVSSEDEALDAAKTVKESVEKRPKVKGRWKRLLGVLNELHS
jgi:hypothetical protein